ncbi:MAG: hypothetical protein DRN01_00440 [Thermoplasmata archaeon]|nr:MAG: hypothetical protein DRN01_00440 [Thermoplasmata archaeon]
MVIVFLALLLTDYFYIGLSPLSCLMVVWKSITKSFLSLLLVVLLCLNHFAFSGEAASSPTPSDTWVDATFDLMVVNGTVFDVDVKLNAHKIKIFDESYSAEEIRQRYDEDGAAFKLVLYNSVESLLEEVFNDCELTISRPTVDENSLASTGGVNPFNPPVVFHMDCRVSLTPAFFDVENITSIGNLVDGVLDMGGRVVYSFGFSADVGWNVTYSFFLPKAMRTTEVKGGILSLSGDEITWEVENWDGNEEKTEDGSFVLKYVNPTSSFDHESITMDVSFDLRPLRYTRLNCTFNVYAVNLTKLTQPPSVVSGLSFIPADGVRLFVDEGLFSWDEFYSKVFEPLREVAEESLSSSLNITFNPVVKVNVSSTSNCSQPYDTSKMDVSPPLSAVVSDDVDLKVCNLSARALLGFVYAGGTVELSKYSIPVGDMGYPFVAHLVLPDDVNGGVSWNFSSPLNTSLWCSGAPHYKGERVERVVEGDLKSIDLDLTSVLTGKSDVIVTVDATEYYNIYHVKPPAEFVLPREIHISQINADLMRLCLEEGVFSDESFQMFLSNQEKTAEQHFLSMFGVPDVKAYIDKNKLGESMSWDGDVSDMSDEKPFTVPSYTHISYNTGFRFSLIPFSFVVENQSIVCSGVPGERVVYRVVLPRGVDVLCNETGVFINRTDDGREVIEIVFDENAGNETRVISYSLKASPMFVVLTFLPCLVGLLIIILLVVILVMVRRRRRRAPPVYRQDETTPPSQK